MDKSLSSKIFIGLFAGLVLGTAIQYLFSGIAILILTYLERQKGLAACLSR